MDWWDPTGGRGILTKLASRCEEYDSKAWTSSMEMSQYKCAGRDVVYS